MVHKWLKFTFVFSVLISSFSIAQGLEEFKSGKNDFVEQSTKELGKAKQFKIKTRLRYAGFFDVDGITPQQKVLVEKISFDKNGNRKELIRYVGDEIVDLKYTFLYDAKSRLIKMETRNTGNFITGKRESKYDKAGNEIERKLFENRRGNMRVVFTYDKEGNIIETKNYDKNKKMISRYENSFENGKAKKTTVYGINGNVQKEIWFIYNSDGKLIREDFKQLSNSYSVKYTYDSQGNVSEVETPETKRLVIYNNNNDILEDKMFMADGIRQYRVVFSYLKNGLQNDETRYDNSEKAAFQSLYEYEFYK
ncbi:MAG: hypothetical protein FD143_2764 [Ignavibacteria bacterium]|nr:MAG: hypothetical protein FD143_2764 [Ignavibacteria bacterium]KAF0155891.1 MAG: hypothetical protein FD188_3063 [Ignavibacteria bacterium]